MAISLAPLVKGFVTKATKSTGTTRSTYIRKVREAVKATGIPAEQAKHIVRDLVFYAQVDQ